MILNIQEFNKSFNQNEKSSIFKIASNYFQPHKGKPIITKLYMIDNMKKTITFPRQMKQFYEHELFQGEFNSYPISTRLENKQSTIKYFNEHQKTITEFVYDYLVNNETMLLNLKAGFGKTFVAGQIITKFKLKSLYIVPTVELARQAKTDLSCLHDYNIDIYDAKFRKKKQVEDYDILISVINTAVNQDIEFFKQFGLVIFDEVHTYVSDKRRDIFWKCRNKYILGMTATIDDRNDGLDKVYKLHLGKVIDGNALLPEQPITNGYDIEVEIIRYSGNPKYTKYLTHEKTKEIFMPYIIQQLMDDPSRWNMLKALIKREYNSRPEANIYVFCEYAEPLRKLHDELNMEDCGLFVGKEKLKSHEVDEMKSKCRILLATYAYAGTGVSIVKMNTIIFASPRVSKMKQVIPRILRTGGDNTITRKVIDIVDEKLSFLVKQHTKRLECYRMFNPTITTVHATPYSTLKILSDIKFKIDTDNMYQESTDEGIFEIIYDDKVFTNSSILHEF